MIAKSRCKQVESLNTRIARNWNDLQKQLQNLAGLSRAASSSPQKVSRRLLYTEGRESIC